MIKAKRHRLNLKCKIIDATAQECGLPCKVYSKHGRVRYIICEAKHTDKHIGA